jgi:hypothetical protein
VDWKIEIVELFHLHWERAARSKVGLGRATLRFSFLFYLFFCFRALPSRKSRPFDGS